MTAIAMASESWPFWRLPREMRDQIYDHLIIARSSKIEYEPLSKEYEMRRSYYLHGPDYEVSLDPAILWLEQRLRNEASEIFIRENLPVYFTTTEGSALNRPRALSAIPRLGSLEKMPASHHWAMKIEYGSTCSINDGYMEITNHRRVSERDRMVFLAADLPVFVAGLLNSEEHRLRHKELRLSIDHRVGASSAGDVEVVQPSARISQLLDPLRSLHSLAKVTIDYPVSELYKQEIITGMTKDPPLWSDIINKAGSLLNQGGQAYQLFLNGFPYYHLDTTIDHCQRALVEICSSGFMDAALMGYGPYELDLLPDRNFIEPAPLESGHYAGFLPASAANDLKIRINGLLAKAYLAYGSHRKARIHVERAIHEFYGSNGGWTVKYPLGIEPWDYRAAACADVLIVAARISYIHGHVGNAKEELCNAQNLDPNHREIKKLSKLLHWRWTLMMRKRDMRDDQRRRKEKLRQTKLLDYILTASNRQDVGDEAFQEAKYQQAMLKYKAALNKVEKIGQTTDYVVVKMQKTLRAQLRMRLTLVSFKLGGHYNACFWAERSLDNRSVITAYFDKGIKDCREHIEDLWREEESTIKGG